MVDPGVSSDEVKPFVDSTLNAASEIGALSISSNSHSSDQISRPFAHQRPVRANNASSAPSFPAFNLRRVGKPDPPARSRNGGGDLPAPTILFPSSGFPFHSLAPPARG